MKHLWYVSVAVGTILLGIGIASAKSPPGAGTRMYDPATETTFKGTVEAVTQGARGQMMGTHLTVKTAEAAFEVLLGPTQYTAGKGFTFAKGDSIEVTGSKVTMGGREYVVAREVIRDGKTLTLRDKTGIPAWAGRGMGRNRGATPSR